ncbi:MAG: tRNA (guanosine(37)-N1)-methyltransferase TrmD [Acidobacteriota bacterium]|nr:tRNA (guanosine(37)-N1)-methyltransferase TrmD [Acidobacteriota bacterium]
MRFDIVTIFPEFFTGPLDHGIVRRARESRLIDARIHDLRSFTHDRHRTVDDRPFGGGAGMVLKPEPIFEAVESLDAADGARTPAISVILLSASGKLFRQETARRFAKLERLVLICGRYEGVDERVAEHLANDELSIGDFVLSGGELPAAIILDVVTRLIPGALGNEDSAVEESFSDPDKALGIESHVPNLPPPETPPSPTLGPLATRRGILDYPHYTRPQSFRGWEVPEVLLSGNHEEIRRWRRKKALAKTLRNRPELTEGMAPRPEDEALLKEIRETA